MIIEQLYQEYRPILLSRAYSYVRDSSLAEEIVQDAFVKALSTGYSSTRNLHAWLYTITTNRALDVLRHQTQTTKRFSPVSLETFAPFLEGESGLWFVELRDELSALPSSHQQILALYIEGRTPRQIATTLGMGYRTVNRHIARIRRCFQEVAA